LYSTSGSGEEYNGGGEAYVSGSYAATIVAMMITPRAEMRWAEGPILEEDLIMILLFLYQRFTTLVRFCWSLSFYLTEIKKLQQIKKKKHKPNYSAT
jgi:hypothetical protein